MALKLIFPDTLVGPRVSCGMKRRVIILTVLAGTAAHAADPMTVAETRIGNTAGWFLCDGVDAPYVAFVAKPLADGTLRVGLLNKTRPTLTPSFRTYTLGRADPGAGQIYWPLSDKGQAAGNLHTFNTGALTAGLTARTPPFTGVRLGKLGFQCRWLADTLFIGIGERRSVVVRKPASGGLVYESFDYAAPAPLETPDGVQRTTHPTQRVSGGRRSATSDDTRFRFANDGYTYVIEVNARGVATLSVEQGGRALQRERLMAYTLAR